MIIHVLPGDAQTEEFRKTGIEGDVVVCREALIDGDVRAGSLDEFWRVREQYLTTEYPEAPRSYRDSVVSEFEKLLDLPASAEVNLWFEYELFCHVNMWFCVWLLRDSAAEVSRVAPITQKKDRTWDGFAGLSAESLRVCYSERIKFFDRDIQLGADLWTAFQSRDYARLRELSHAESACFPYLKEACEAEIEKETRPHQVLLELQNEGLTGFDETFAAFRERAGVYGFGDAQVRKLIDRG